MDTSGVVEKIKAFVTGGDAAPEIPEPPKENPVASVKAAATVRQWLEIGDVEENVIREAELRGFQCYRIAIDIDRDCLMKKVRAFLVF